MIPELPVLRLGLAGFSAAEAEWVQAQLATVAPSHLAWQVVPFADADAWWVNGGRTQLMPDGTVRVAPGMPTQRALHLSLADVDRPIAFSLPLATPQLQPGYTFTLGDLPAMASVLQKFSAWLQPVVAQFCLASSILDNQTALGSGVFQLSVNGRLVGLVDLHGSISVLPNVGPGDFEDALWKRCGDTLPPVPDNFVRTDLSHIMWQYAMRTRRSVLPPHYRTQALFFRRPPRLPQRVLKDSHLLLLRELAQSPGNFEDLQQRTGLGEALLARDLTALYLVGSITSNPKRAAAGALRRVDTNPDSLLSQPPALLPARDAGAIAPAPAPGRRPVLPSDLTAPAPLYPR